MDLNTEESNAKQPSRPSGSEVGAATTEASTHERWTPFEQVVLDLDLPHISIARALERSDDPAIWREYARARDEDGFLDCLAMLAGSHTTEQPHFRDPARSTQWRHMLVAVPFLLPASAQPLAPASRADRGGAAELVGDLQRWAGCQQEARTMLGCVNYAELCRWSPVTQREHLQLLAGQRRGPSVPREPLAVEVPSGFPQLAFAVASVRCWNAPPHLPDPLDASSAAAWELRSRMAACLSYANQCQVRAQQVLLPARLHDAVLAGLRLWVGELAAQHLVRAWDVQPGAKDVMHLQLAGCVDEGCRGQLAVRGHQVGRGGLSTLMADLELHFGRPGLAVCAPRNPRVSRLH